ncbi:MAG: molybdopterin oxidoreductase family protein, partial [Methanomicrobiales archaeon]|nr:molybdopterin oxidoreductase family protein [Methanomicrobiales archaeon]
LDILLDYARRMDFRDKDGDPLIAWSDPRGAFEGWKACSRGRLCDYSGLSYEKLTGGSGVQWPCNAEHPDGTERLYTDLVFPSRADVCESFGHDLELGAALSPDGYRASDPGGRAMLKGARYIPPFEEPDAEYPFSLTTGRIVYHFHTRTKTGRSPELEDAAPMAFAQISEADAGRLGVRDHEMVDVVTRRGTVRIPAKIGDIEQGHIFIPFHYGYWDEEDDRPRAANELTLPLWDPISKQPYFKTAAARLQRVEATGAVPRVPGPTTKTEGVSGRDPSARPHVADYLGVLSSANAGFSHACDIVADHHARHLEIVTGLGILKGYSQEIEDLLTPFVEKYGKVTPERPEALHSALFEKHSGEYGMIRDLHDLYVVASNVQIAAAIVNYAAEGLRDADLLKAIATIMERAKAQTAWTETHLRHQAGHALVVPS